MLVLVVSAGGFGPEGLVVFVFMVSDTTGLDGLDSFMSSELVGHDDSSASGIVLVIKSVANG